jgi:hypothetical protein
MFSGQCNVKDCKKKITGLSKAHFEYLLKQHKLAKHPDIVKIG